MDIDHAVVLDSFQIPNRPRKRKTALCAQCGSASHRSSACPKRVRVCVVGDSHTALWSSLQRHFGQRVRAVRTRIAGMSAYGLANPESRSQAAASLLHCVSHVPCSWVRLLRYVPALLNLAPPVSLYMNGPPGYSQRCAGICDCRPSGRNTITPSHALV